MSVLIPIRNAATTLRDCLDSIASQIFHDYEIIAINDGSNDETLELLLGHARQENRLRVFTIPPSGIVSALTAGLARSRGKYIARMDADDIMHPARLARQVDYLQRNPLIDLVACQVTLFPESEVKGGYEEYIRWQNDCVSHNDICQEMYVESPLAHPTVMFRKHSVEKLGGYRGGDFPEDYELWLRMASQGCQFHKLSETLLSWREREGRASRVDPRYSRTAFDRLRASYLAKDERLRMNRPLAVWGAGRRTRKRVAHLFKYGFKPDVWIDIDPKKIDNKIDHVWVRSPECLINMYASNTPFVLCYVNNRGARELIRKQLNSYGYQRGIDYLMIG